MFTRIAIRVDFFHERNTVSRGTWGILCSVWAALNSSDRTLHRYIQHAVGSLDVPMSDKALEVKFADLADGILPSPVIRQAMDLCWNVETLGNAADIAKMCISS